MTCKRGSQWHPPVIARYLVPKQSRFKNVVAQFIGQLCLMNQATTKVGGEATWTDTPQGKS
jgi:hypothetical protein